MNAPLKIIVADDEVHILRVVELKLRSAGFEVVCAHDGLEARHEILQSRPSLVITDYHMPGINGMELAEMMYLREDLREIPIVLLTAKGFSLNPNDLAKTNIVRIVSKPFSPRELLALAQQLSAGLTPTEA